jgi:hypothetical protein
MTFEKRIISWECGDGDNKFLFSRAFIFGNYGDNFAKYKALAEEIKKDFAELKPKDENIDCSIVRESSYMKNFTYVSFLLPNNYKKEGYVNWNKFDFR